MASLLSGIGPNPHNPDWASPRVREILKREVDRHRDNPQYPLSGFASQFMNQHRPPPTAQDPFSSNRDLVATYDDWARRQDRQLMANMTGVSQTRAGIANIDPNDRLTAGSINDQAWNQAQAAIDYEQLERARRRMMDTNTRRGHRITSHEFMSELSHRLEEAHPNLYNWTMEHGATENVDMWQIIAACAIDQMLNGSVKDLESDAITDINKELQKLEEVKHGKPMAKPRADEDQRVPF